MDNGQGETKGMWTNHAYKQRNEPILAQKDYTAGWVSRLSQTR